MVVSFNYMCMYNKYFVDCGCVLYVRTWNIVKDGENLTWRGKE